MNAQIANWKLHLREAGEQGATMIEYAFMLALIALVAFAAVGLIGPIITRMFAAVIPF